MSKQTANIQEIEMITPYSTLGKDAQAAVLVVSLTANLFVFITWLAYELMLAQ